MITKAFFVESMKCETVKTLDNDLVASESINKIFLSC